MRKEMYELAAALRETGHAAGAIRVTTMAQLMHEQGVIPDDLEGYVTVQRKAEPGTDWTGGSRDNPAHRPIIEEFELFDPTAAVEVAEEAVSGAVLTPAFAHKLRTRLDAGMLPDDTPLQDMRLVDTQEGEWSKREKVAVNGALNNILRRSYPSIPTVGGLRDARTETLVDIRNIGPRTAIALKYAFRRAERPPRAQQG